jgi:two-component system NtrC family response regulator
MASLLIVDDEALLARELSRSLESEGHGVRTALTGAAALEAVRRSPPDLVLLDQRLPDRSGLEVLQALRGLDPGLPVVLITAHGGVRDAVNAIRAGAVDYLQKPLDLDEVALLVERVLAQERRNRELDYLRDRGRQLGLVGRDRRVAEILAHAERLRDTNLPPGKRPTILFRGETGTGKGVLAHAVHKILGRGPFIEFACPALPATLVEAELFGHERGAFTDARSSRPGLFEAAEGGTLFLDEIGELSLEVQAKLLKVIDEKRVRRLGSTSERTVDVHVMAATSRDLEGAVAAGTFRTDLLHRLRVLEIEVPPLRDRPEDIRLLGRHFASELGGRYYGRPARLSAEAEERLVRYPWPGNVRELRNVIERAVFVGRAEELPASAFSGLIPAGWERSPYAFVLPEGGVDLRSLERELLSQALERAEGSRTRAAALLGLTRYALRYRAKKFGLG